MPETTELDSFVVSDPEIMGGLPVIRGTRIPVDLVLDAEAFYRAREGRSEPGAGWRALERMGRNAPPMEGDEVPPDVAGTRHRLPWRAALPGRGRCNALRALACKT